MASRKKSKRKDPSPSEHELLASLRLKDPKDTVLESLFDFDLLVPDFTAKTLKEIWESLPNDLGLPSLPSKADKSSLVKFFRKEIQKIVNQNASNGKTQKLDEQDLDELNSVEHKSDEPATFIFDQVQAQVQAAISEMKSKLGSLVKKSLAKEQASGRFKSASISADFDSDVDEDEDEEDGEDGETESLALNDIRGMISGILSRKKTFCGRLLPRTTYTRFSL